MRSDTTSQYQAHGSLSYEDSGLTILRLSDCMKARINFDGWFISGYYPPIPRHPSGPGASPTYTISPDFSLLVAPGPLPINSSFWGPKAQTPYKYVDNEIMLKVLLPSDSSLFSMGGCT